MLDARGRDSCYPVAQRPTGRDSLDRSRELMYWKSSKERISLGGLGSGHRPTHAAKPASCSTLTGLMRMRLSLCLSFLPLCCNSLHFERSYSTMKVVPYWERTGKFNVTADPAIFSFSPFDVTIDRQPKLPELRHNVTIN
ncbi:uncharacterized protein CLUP02_13573 [Colletotrichum lupini]|uniref:Uncharacterized protein n=1 Tax=Colletotrichum lupini TaxID=145971 RepID=A0A9Q8T2M1_9PEZI|nr:uncharacterized protein CLUP02_13573 [Colletotrichum lupini]UQC88051.1 hypothetical protein CLUP02_13573 [Colletotrichum lupini]